MSIFLRKIFLLVAAVLIISPAIFAQAPDTLVVPTQIDGSPLGAINKFIIGDTTASGERNNPNRYYKLERDSIYFLDGTLSANFDLNLIADKPDANHRPAILAQGVLADGSSLVVFVACKSNATFKNIYFQTAQPTGTGESTITVQLLKDSARYVFDGCHFEWGLWLTMGSWAKHTKVYITNSYFRNVENATSVWNGRGISFQDRDADTVVIVNNTFFNLNSFIFQGQHDLINYARFEHNTIVNSVKWPIQWQWQTNANFSNNLFYNVHSYGESPSDRVGQDIDSLDFGIFNLFLLPKLFTDTLGHPEADRVVDLRNNNWFYSQEVQDYWSGIDSISGEPFMNSRTQNMFDDDANWPNLVEENTMNLDPGFVNSGDGASQMVQWMEDIRAGLETSYWGWDPDNDRFGVTWPLPEDLSYTNGTLLTGADGFPVGDLNWFPDKKAQWLTGVKSIKNNSVPKGYALEQNYPNPFNPTTLINYSIPRSSNVKIAIFNSLGQLVKTLVNQNQGTGNYSVDWNGTDAAGNVVSSGIYFYQLKTSDFIQTRKMLLMK